MPGTAPQLRHIRALPSTPTHRWIVLWRQEGDEIFMIGDFWTGQGKDAMQWELVTTKDEGFGHWECMGRGRRHGNWIAKGNTRIAKLGTCSQLTHRQRR